MFSKPKAFLGVDLGADGVKLVELREQKKRPMLFTYALAAEPQDVHRLLAEKGRQVLAPEKINLDHQGDIGAEKKSTPMIDDSNERVEKYAATLKTACAAAKIFSKTAVVSLPISAVFNSIVNMPAVGEKEFLSVLRAEVKKLLPYPLEEMVLDYQVLEAFSTDKVKKILINAAPKSVVEFYAKVFRAAGLTLDSLEPESTALARSLIGRDTAITMLIDIGAERTNFFIIDQGAPITSHTIESGGNKMNRILMNVLAVDEKEIVQLKHNLYKRYLAGQGPKRQEFLEKIMPVIDPIASQIEYGFDLYLRQTGNENKRPEKIVLTGGAAMVPYLTEYLAERFKMKCYLGDPWARVVYQEKLKSVLNEIGPRMSVSIGLALKNLL